MHEYHPWQQRFAVEDRTCLGGVHHRSSASGEPGTYIHKINMISEVETYLTQQLCGDIPGKKAHPQ